MRNLQGEVKKAFCYQKLFWTFTVWMNCSSNLKNFANSWPSALNFKSFSLSLEQFFLTVCQNNFGNKIPVLFFFRWTRICFWLWLCRGQLPRPASTTTTHPKVSRIKVYDKTNFVIQGYFIIIEYDLYSYIFFKIQGPVQ